MNRKIFIFSVLLGISGVGRADDLETRNGLLYADVKVSKTDPLGIEITHQGGVARIQFSEMTDTGRRKYGYDAEKEAEFQAREKKLMDEAAKAAKEKNERIEEKKEEQERVLQEELAAQNAARRHTVARPGQVRDDLFKPSGISVVEFHATRPQDATVFLAEAKLDDYFNFDFGRRSNPDARKLYWSVRLRTPEGVAIGHGYILKSGRGAALNEILKDEKWHSIIARLKYSSASEDPSVFFLCDFQARPEEDAPMGPLE